MDKVTLEITVISAENLKNVRIFGKFMRTYAVVWSDPATKKTTRTDREGGLYPVWNEKLQMHANQRFIHQKGSAVIVQIYCKTVVGRKQVGWAKMPFSDLLEGYGTPYSIHFFSYRVRRSNGKSGGTINLSVRLLHTSDDQYQPLSATQSGLKHRPFDSKPAYNLNQPSCSYSTENNYYSDRRSRQQQEVHSASLNGCVVGVPLSIVQQNPQFNSYMQHAIHTSVVNAGYSSFLPPPPPPPALLFPESQHGLSVRPTQASRFRL